MHDYYFSPTIISSLGTTESFQIGLHNVSDQQHTFTIDDLGVDVTVQPGDTQNIIVENKTGNYIFYCRFHRDRGMEGTLPISRSSP
jgi:plastocyanin